MADDALSASPLAGCNLLETYNLQDRPGKRK
jgi:hypothetical protein